MGFRNADKQWMKSVRHTEDGDDGQRRRNRITVNVGSPRRRSGVVGIGAVLGRPVHLRIVLLPLRITVGRRRRLATVASPDGRGVRPNGEGLRPVARRFTERRHRPPIGITAYVARPPNTPIRIRRRDPELRGLGGRVDRARSGSATGREAHRRP